MRLALTLLMTSALGLSACSGSSTPGADGIGTGAKSEFANEPALETSQEQLDAALRCTGFTHPDKPPVLLVHGTFTSGYEQYDWTYLPLLDEHGFDVCTVTYPDRGFIDAQISAEYVVNALRRMRARSGGRKIAMIGHSQGVMVPRWAIRWWPSARDAVSDFVMEAGPNHGINPLLITTSGVLTTLGISGTLGQPEVVYQFYDTSKFMQASNSEDETPGDIDYTALYTQFDELVQPASPIPTAAVDFGKNNPKVSNILLQQVCPGRVVDHVSIGLTDGLAFALALDAISNPGPANIERAGGAAKLCGLLPIVPDQAASSQAVMGLVQAMQQESANSIPNLHLAHEEPPLKAYAQSAAP